MGWKNLWEVKGAAMVEQVEPLHLQLVAEGRLEQAVRAASNLALDRYSDMVGDGVNAMAAKEIAEEEMRQQLLGSYAED